MFHVCHGGLQYSFLCPNSTVFNQQVFVCDWWYNVECDRAPQFYNLNRFLGDIEARLPDLIGATSQQPARRRQGKNIRDFDDPMTNDELLQTVALMVELPSFSERQEQQEQQQRGESRVTLGPGVNTTRQLVEQFARVISPIDNDLSNNLEEVNRFEGSELQRFAPKFRVTERSSRPTPTPKRTIQPLSEQVINKIKSNFIDAPPVVISQISTEANQRQKQRNSYLPEKKPIEGDLRVEPTSDYLNELNESPAKVSKSISDALENAFAGDLGLLEPGGSIGNKIEVPSVSGLPLSKGSQSSRSTTESYNGGVDLENSVENDRNVFVKMVTKPTPSENNLKNDQELYKLVNGFKLKSTTTQRPKKRTKSNTTRQKSITEQKPKQQPSIEEQRPLIIERRPAITKQRPDPTTKRPVQRTRRPSTTTQRSIRPNQNKRPFSQQPQGNYGNRVVSTTQRVTIPVQLPSFSRGRFNGGLTTTSRAPSGFQSLNELNRKQKLRGKIRRVSSGETISKPTQLSETGIVYDFEKVQERTKARLKNMEDSLENGRNSDSEERVRLRANEKPADEITIERAPSHEWLYFITGA